MSEANAEDQKKARSKARASKDDPDDVDEEDEDIIEAAMRLSGLEREYGAKDQQAIFEIKIAEIDRRYADSLVAFLRVFFGSC